MAVATAEYQDMINHALWNRQRTPELSDLVIENSDGMAHSFKSGLSRIAGVPSAAINAVQRLDYAVAERILDAYIAARDKAKEGMRAIADTNNRQFVKTGAWSFAIGQASKYLPLAFVVNELNIENNIAYYAAASALGLVTGEVKESIIYRRQFNEDFESGEKNWRMYGKYRAANFVCSFPFRAMNAAATAAYSAGLPFWAAEWTGARTSGTLEYAVSWQLHKAAMSHDERPFLKSLAAQASEKTSEGWAGLKGSFANLRRPHDYHYQHDAALNALIISRQQQAIADSIASTSLSHGIF